MQEYRFKPRTPDSQSVVLPTSEPHHKSIYCIGQGVDVNTASQASQSLLVGA